jgi:hypothetical protein
MSAQRIGLGLIELSGVHVTGAALPGLSLRGADGT